MQATENTFESVAAEHFFDAEAFEIFCEYEDLTPEAGIEPFQDSYAGTFESVSAWAEEFLEDTGGLSEIPESLRYYFDYAAWARDCALNGDIWTRELAGGDVAIFWRR